MAPHRDSGPGRQAVPIRFLRKAGEGMKRVEGVGCGRRYRARETLKFGSRSSGISTASFRSKLAGFPRSIEVRSWGSRR